MKRQHELVGALVFAFAVALATSESEARTHFVNASNRPIVVSVAGSTRIYALAGDGESTNGLAWKTLTSEWTTIANPSGISQFWMTTGASAVTTTSGVRVYAISYGQGQASSQLYEYAMDQNGNGSWRPLGLPSDSNLNNGAQIAAGYDSASNRTWIGIRTAYNGISTDGHVYTCQFVGSGSCTWEDESCRGYPSCPSPQVASTQSPLGLDPTPLDGQLAAAYMVRNDGHLLRYRWNINDWDDLGKPVGAIVDLTGIQARTEGGTTRVVTATWDQVSWGDRLQSRRSTGGTTWTSWADLTGGGPGQGISFALNNIFMVPGTGSRRIWVVALQTGPENNALWSCDWDDVSFSWTQRGRPSDQRAYFDGLGGGISGTLTRSYVTGSVGFVPQYAYSYDSSTGSWENHLAPRDGSVPLATDSGMAVGETAASEAYGGVLATGVSSLSGLGNVVAWTSSDDGSTWSDLTRPFGVDALTNPHTDPSVGVDAGRTAWALALGPPITIFGRSLRLTRWHPDLGWSAAVSLSTASGVAMDRPWLAVDPTKTNVLHVLYLGDNGTAPFVGRWTYCTGASDCLNATGASWCPGSGVGYPIEMSGVRLSRTDCAGSRFYGAPNSSAFGGNPGCMVAQGGDGALWAAIQDDVSCATLPGGYPPLFDGNPATTGDTTRAIGIRQVTYPSWPACGAPNFGAAECIYYTEPHYSQLRASTTAGGLAIGPGSYRHFGINLAAARDASGMLGLTVQAFRDTATGGPCLPPPASATCRADVLFAYRRATPSVQWCGSTCVSPPAGVSVGTMLVVNDDVSIPLAHVDHVAAHVSVLDGARFVAAWMDFADDPADLTYSLRQSAFSASSMAPVERAWLATPTSVFSPDSGRYLDVYEQASARLRMHLFHVVSPTPGSLTTPRAWLVSPWAH